MNTKESKLIELKESWRDEYLKWICGFANAEGGTLIIGKNDDGVIVGIDNARRLLEEIPNKARDILGVIVDVNLVMTDALETVEIIVEPYPIGISTTAIEKHIKSLKENRHLKRVGGAKSGFWEVLLEVTP